MAHHNTLSRLAAVLMIALASVQGASAENDVAATAMRMDPQGRPLIDVSINGAPPASFILDTAAQGFMLNPNAIQTLGLSPSGTHALLHGASGARPAELYLISSVTALGVEARSVQAIAHASLATETAGILSPRIFAPGRLELDYRQRQVRLHSHAERTPFPRGEAIDVELRYDVFVLAPVKVGGVDAIAVIDTGARRSIANAHLRRALGFTDGDSRLRPTEAIGGVSGHETPAQEAEIAGIALGSTTLATPPLAFADLAVFAPLGLAEQPALILGNDILSRLGGLAIDYRDADLRVWR